MKYSEYVDVLVQNSGCFSYDHYLQGLRKYTRNKVLSGDIGVVKQVPIDSNYINEHPIALILGETNRLNSRFELVSNLLIDYEKDKNFNIKETAYFKTLFKPYLKSNVISQYRVRQEIADKITRVIKLYQWLQQTDGNFQGAKSFISGHKIIDSKADYPISLNFGNSNEIHNYVQLDGSHRRSVACYLGFNEVASIVVTLEELENYIQKTKPVYFKKYSKNFFSLITKLQIVL